MTKTSYRECNPSPHRTPDLFLEAATSLVPSTYQFAADGEICHDLTVKCAPFFVHACCSCVESKWRLSGCNSPNNLRMKH